MTDASEAEVLAKAKDVEADARRRIEAGVDQLAKCATCPYNAVCWRLVMATKSYAS